MALYKDPKVAIIESAARLNNITLVLSDYRLGVPTPIVGNGIINTSIKLEAITPQAAYEGDQTVTYTRLNLADLLVMLPTPIQAHGIANITDAYTWLNKNFGLNFTSTDLDLTTPVALTDDAGNITLTALETSLGWIGSVTLPFVKGNLNIRDLITVKNLPGLLYPARDETKPFGELYSYWRDFSNWQSTLELVVAGTADLPELATVLTAATGDTWITDAAGRFSLQGASVDYSGATTGRTDVNTDYAGAVIVSLGEGSLGYSGKLILHYGINLAL